MLISVENGRTMILSQNIILLLFFSVTITLTHSQVDLDYNDVNEGDYGVIIRELLDNYNAYLRLFKSNLRGSEKVRIQLYYECLCPDCINFDIKEFGPVVETMGQYLDIQTYPFGNGDIIDDNGEVKIKCQHGPAECYGNKLHACALDKLQHATALLYNICLMNSTDGSGSDDDSADRCGKSMNVDSEPIKDCAKGARGTELLLYYGKESKKANFHYVPYVLINGKEYQGDDFKGAVCDAFTNPPPDCK